MANRPFQPVPNTPLVANPTGDAIWKRWLQGLQSFLGSAVRGPGSSTDNAVARWDGTTGTFLNNSGVIIDDSNNVSGVVNLTTTGSTILGDAAADTLTLNAGTWTLGNNFIATRAAGTLATGATSLCDFQSTFTGHSGGTTIARPWAFTAVLQGANNVDRTNALTQTVNHSGSGTLTLARSINNNVLVSSTGTITTAHGVESVFTLSSSGNITTGAHYYAEEPVFSSTGAITTLYGFQSNITGSANITNAIAFYARDMSASTVMTGMELALSAGSGKKNINVTGTADNSLAGPLYLAQDNKTQQTAAAIYAGTGAPNNANGNNGDFYMRADGTVATNDVMYHKEAGAWVAFTTT